MKHCLRIMVALCLPLSAFCQDITGLWKGTLYNDSTKQYLQYEIVINKEKGKLTGYSHTWFMINDQKHYGVKKLRIFKARDGKIIIQDEDLLANDYPIAPPKNVRQMNVLDIVNKGNETSLDGLFVTNITREYSQLTGHVSIKKVSPLTQSDLMQYLQKNEKESYLAVVK